MQSDTKTTSTFGLKLLVARGAVTFKLGSTVLSNADGYKYLTSHF